MRRNPTTANCPRRRWGKNTPKNPGHCGGLKRLQPLKRQPGGRDLVSLFSVTSPQRNKINIWGKVAVWRVSIPNEPHCKEHSKEQGPTTIPTEPRSVRTYKDTGRENVLQIRLFPAVYLPRRKRKASCLAVSRTFGSQHILGREPHVAVFWASVGISDEQPLPWFGCLCCVWIYWSPYRLSTRMQFKGLLFDELAFTCRWWEKDITCIRKGEMGPQQLD